MLFSTFRLQRYDFCTESQRKLAFFCETTDPVREVFRSVDMQQRSKGHVAYGEKCGRLRAKGQNATGQS